VAISGLLSIVVVVGVLLAFFGTPVFDQAVSSSAAEEEQRTKLRVASDVVAEGAVVVRKGAPATGIVVKAEQGKPFGINATLRLALSLAQSPQGMLIALQLRSQGQPAGPKTGMGASPSSGGPITPLSRCETLVQ
jgi:hypothetical protein